MKACDMALLTAEVQYLQSRYSSNHSTQLSHPKLVIWRYFKYQNNIVSQHDIARTATHQHISRCLENKRRPLLKWQWSKEKLIHQKPIFHRENISSCNIFPGAKLRGKKNNRIWGDSDPDIHFRTCDSVWEPNWKKTRGHRIDLTLVNSFRPTILEIETYFTTRYICFLSGEDKSSGPKRNDDDDWQSSRFVSTHP